MPKSILGRKQVEEAAKLTGKPNLDSLVKTGEELASQDPDVAKVFAKQKPFIESIKDFPTFLRRMQRWGNTTYLRGGGIKAGAKADLYDGLYRAGLDVLRIQAPEVYKYRSLLRFAFELPKSAMRTLWKLTIGKAFFKGL